MCLTYGNLFSAFIVFKRTVFWLLNFEVWWVINFHFHMRVLFTPFWSLFMYVEGPSLGWRSIPLYSLSSLINTFVQVSRNWHQNHMKKWKIRTSIKYWLWMDVRSCHHLFSMLKVCIIFADISQKSTSALS